MAGYGSIEEIALLARAATVLASEELPETFDDASARACRKTSPWQKGHIVWADLDGYDLPPKRVLLFGVELTERNDSPNEIIENFRRPARCLKINFASRLQQIGKSMQQNSR